MGQHSWYTVWEESHALTRDKSVRVWQCGSCDSCDSGSLYDSCLTEYSIVALIIIIIIIFVIIIIIISIMIITIMQCGTHLQSRMMLCTPLLTGVRVMS